MGDAWVDTRDFFTGRTARELVNGGEEWDI